MSLASDSPRHDRYRPSPDDRKHVERMVDHQDGNSRRLLPTGVRHDKDGIGPPRSRSCRVVLRRGYHALDPLASLHFR